MCKEREESVKRKNPKWTKKTEKKEELAGSA